MHVRTSFVSYTILYKKIGVFLDVNPYQWMPSLFFDEKCGVTLVQRHPSSSVNGT